MRSLFIALMGWVVLSPSVVRACDICGCSSNAQALGLLPLVQRHFIGARWQGQGYRTTAHGSESDSWEYFHSLDIWGRWMPHPRWQVMAFVPYRYNLRQFDSGTQQYVEGLGDVSLLAHFSILDPHQQISRRWKHALQIGDGYRFGPRANGTLRLFHIGNWWRTTWTPYLGAQVEYRGADFLEGEQQPETGGWIALAHAGVEVFARSFTFGLAWSQPLAHELSSGFVAPRGRLAVSFAIFLGKRQTDSSSPIPLPFIFQNVQPDTKPIGQ